jgi:hypothetical protein
MSLAADIMSALPGGSTSAADTSPGATVVASQALISAAFSPTAVVQLYYSPRALDRAYVAVGGRADLHS